MQAAPDSERAERERDDAARKRLRDETARKRLRNAAVLLGALALGFAGATVVLARELSRRKATPPIELDRGAPERFDPTTRASWDSHPDADVARVLQPRLSGDHAAHSNRFGLSDEEFDTPKPAGVVRVVLLGDSFVHGAGVEWNERAGAQLERLLVEHTGLANARIEVLHAGISSWNVRAECAWLRRALSWLEPDLVVHVLVFNDLDDTPDVRGFGGMANFSSQYRARANALTSGELAVRLGAKRFGLLGEGLDHESRTRFAEARADLDRLERVVQESGGEYLMLFNWTGSLCVAAEHLARGRSERSMVYVSDAFATKLSHRLAEFDPHWSAEGHRGVASVLYAAIADRGMLSELALRPAAEHTARLLEVHTQGAAEATSQALERHQSRLLEALTSSFELPMSDDSPVIQIHAGLERNGSIAPYFSCVLATRGGGAVRLRAERLARREFAGAKLRVEADEHVLGELALDGDEPLDVRWPLPDELRRRPALTIRMVADDYLYLKDLRRCAVLTLREVAIEP